MAWNRLHQPMPNSGDDDIRPGVNRENGPLSQGALIVPVPGDTAMYYLFSLYPSDRSTMSGTLRYSRIDMRLDGGRGDVVAASKNQVLGSGLAGRLTAVRHTNRRDYWLITHLLNSNAYLIYALTEAGIGRADTVRIGSVINETYGFVRASPNGRKLACSSRGVTAQSLDLLDFNPATGKFTNYVSLGRLRVAYGLSISPDNTKLYVSTMNVAAVEGDTYQYDYIRQYDLSAGDPSAISASGKRIIVGNPATNIQQDKRRYSDFYAPSLQLGPDGRIYNASNGNALLCAGCGYRFFVINKPNEPGFACDVQAQTAKLGTGTVGNASDLPNFMQHYFNGLQPRNCSFDQSDACTNANVLVFPNPASEVIELLVTDLCFTPYTLRIINAAGQVVGQYEITKPHSQALNVSLLANGVYFAELRFTDRTTVKKFVKF